MEYATPNASSSAHKVSFNKPIVSSIPLDESVSTQNASIKMAGVRISAGLTCGRYFFMVVMGMYFELFLGISRIELHSTGC